MAERGQAERGRRPGAATIAGSVLGVLLVAALLLTPTGGNERGLLTSRSMEAGGARALHELQRRSGWRVERRDVPYGDSLDPRAVYAVLAPPVELTASETHALLQAVRAGAGLLVVVTQGGSLADSLGMYASSSGAPVTRSDEAPERFCADSLNRRGLMDWPNGRVQSLWLWSTRKPAVVFTSVDVDSTRAALERASGGATRVRAGTDAIATPGRPRAAMAGFTLGAGRVVAVADPDLLRNDVLRVCQWNAGPTAARALDWLAGAGGRRLVFDEYHQDRDVAPAPMRAVGRALTGTPWGRMLLAGAAAALALLAAAAVRPLAPEPRLTVERRSPLEHVRALARAYSQAGASRLVARRLARGLRRRHGLATLAGGDDDAYLQALASRHPALVPDLATLRRAMADPIPTDQLPALGDAVARVDSRLRPSSS